LETRDHVGRVEIDGAGVLTRETEVIAEASESDGTTDETFELVTYNEL